jgi:hypothetical protein
VVVWGIGLTLGVVVVVVVVVHSSHAVSEGVVVVWGIGLTLGVVVVVVVVLVQSPQTSCEEMGERIAELDMG